MFIVFVGSLWLEMFEFEDETRNISDFSESLEYTMKYQGSSVNIEVPRLYNYHFSYFIKRRYLLCLRNIFGSNRLF